MLPIKQAVKWCFHMPPQITYASALPGKTGKHKNHVFSLKCCITWERCCMQLDCVACTVHQCAVFLKEKLSSVLCLIASTFVEIVRYPVNTVHWLLLRLDEEQLPSFTQQPTLWESWLTHSMLVTDSMILGPVWFPVLQVVRKHKLGEVGK